MTIWTTLISTEELATVIDNCTVIDCRHDLKNRDAGPAAYAEAHIPSAHFLHQDDDLASHHTGSNGRHPLPDPNELLAKLRSLGLKKDGQLVVYDSHGGSLAGRLWWLARWLGHKNVAVLDGGQPAWQAAGFPLSTDVPERAPVLDSQDAQHNQVPSVSVQQLMQNLESSQWLVVDARAPERWRGEIEPMDPVAGSIPGSINRPQTNNLRPDGRFKPGPVLRAEFEKLLDGRPSNTIVHSCGSGVSACHNILAMEMAGLEGSILYPGSWSEWCADSSRPIGPIKG